MPLRFSRTGRLVIKPKSVYTPIKQPIIKHVLVEDTLPENIIDGDNDTDLSKKNDQAGMSISNTMQSSSHEHKKQRYYYRYHMHPCQTVTTEDDTVQQRKYIRRIQIIVSISINKLIPIR